MSEKIELFVRHPVPWTVECKSLGVDCILDSTGDGVSAREIVAGVDAIRAHVEALEQRVKDAEARAEQLQCEVDDYAHAYPLMLKNWNTASAEIKVLRANEHAICNVIAAAIDAHGPIFIPDRQIMSDRKRTIGAEETEGGLLVTIRDTEPDEADGSGAANNEAFRELYASLYNESRAFPPGVTLDEVRRRMEEVISVCLNDRTAERDEYEERALEDLAALLAKLTPAAEATGKDGAQ